MDAKSFKIMLCDDSILVRKKLKESIEKCGCFTILEASDGQAAVDMYKEHRPHLVFMDIVMPSRDGIGALQEIKEHDSEARVVMLSSSGTRSHLAKAMEAGALDFIQKPWEQAQIISIIARVVRDREVQNV